jgi:uncharacterized protein YdcH (DUF465 family)
MDELEQKYAELNNLYEDEIKNAINDPEKADMSKIKKLNLQLGDIIHQMIEALTNVKKESGNIVVYRDELLQRLRRIQKEYNGLADASDNVETLRMIRKSEYLRANKDINFYMFFFLLGAVILIVLILFTSQLPSLPRLIPRLQQPLPYRVQGNPYARSPLSF